jgi:glutathione S-transferase
MLNLYGNPMSTCTRVVLMTLAETGTPYEMHTLDFAKAEHKSPAHVARQPFGRIPAIEDDGFEMFESRAIAHYINEKAHGKLVPTDLKARARTEQWINIETNEFTGNAMKFVYEHVFKRPQDKAVLEAAGKGLATTLGVMDKQLGKTPYLAGSEFTLADVVFMPYVDYVMMTPARELVEKCPNVMAWWGKVSERPTWKKATGKA